MNQLTNINNMSLAMAVWLAHDEYDNGSDEHQGQNLISATSLLKPTRQLVLTPRVPQEETIIDVSDLISSSFGTAIHDSIEKAWTQGYQQSMKRLGYPQKMIDKVKINPETVEDGDIPVYLEQRAYRTLKLPQGEIVISGKFDQIINGEVNDVKSTSVYTYINRSNEDYYRIQGSIYRWLNPEKITSDLLRIQHVFTDWQGFQAKTDPNYPQKRVVEFTVELMSLRETEVWIRQKVNEIVANQGLPEPEVVRCSDEELWMSQTVWKYYADPAKAQAGGRSTKNFTNYPAAASHVSKAGKGILVEVPGVPKRCGYCAAAPICTQKDEYDHD